MILLKIAVNERSTRDETYHDGLLTCCDASSFSDVRVHSLHDHAQFAVNYWRTVCYHFILSVSIALFHYCRTDQVCKMITIQCD